MERIKTVKISSRRSCNIANQYLTFEMSLEADIGGLDEKEKKKYIKKMWDYAGEEVDKQIAETAEAIR